MLPCSRAGKGYGCASSAATATASAKAVAKAVAEAFAGATNGCAAAMASVKAESLAVVIANATASASATACTTGETCLQLTQLPRDRAQLLPAPAAALHSACSTCLSRAPHLVVYSRCKTEVLHALLSMLT